MIDLVVVSGPPGSGKSTVARAIADRFDPSVVVVGDAFFDFLHRGAIPPWLPESNPQNEIVVEAAAAAAGRFARSGFATVYDGVLGPWFLEAFLDAAGRPTVDYVILLPTLDRCLDRIRARTGHGFDDEPAATHMHASFTDAGFDLRHILDNGALDVETTVEAILAGAAEGRWAAS